MKTLFHFAACKAAHRIAFRFSSVLLVLIFTTASADLFGQSLESRIVLYPELSNGYVAWVDDPEVEHYELVVYERVALSDTTFHDVPVWRHHEWRNNYVYIPKEYRPSGEYNRYGVHLFAKDGSNNIIDEEPIIPFYDCPGCWQNVFYDGCFVICNGPDYAWKVQQLIPATGGGRKYRLERASWNGAPIYEYMSNAVYNNYLASNLQWFTYYYELTWSHFNLNDNNLLIKNIVNSPGVEYKDKAGNVLHHDIHPTLKAVRKAAGDWRWAVSSITETSHLAGNWDSPTSLCLNNVFQHAVNLMNSYSDVDPPLACLGQPYTSPSGTNWNFNWSNCDHLYDDVETYDWDNDSTHIASFLNDWLDCVGLNLPDEDQDGGGGGGNGSGNIPYANISNVSLSLFDKNGVLPVFQKSRSDLVDDNGNMIPFQVTLDPGLYYLYATLNYSTELIPEIFFEVKKQTIIGISYAQMFDFTVFPVPHVGDTYSVNMQSLSDLDCIYSVYDFNSNLLHRASLRLEQGHNRDHYIIPDNPLPNGLILHRFDFDDGSAKTALTIKTD